MLMKFVAASGGHHPYPGCAGAAPRANCRCARYHTLREAPHEEVDRHSLGDRPTTFLKALLNTASDS